MSKITDGDPFRIGHVVTVPPGKALPSETGFTAVWEEEMGLVYVSNKEATIIDLSAGRLIWFEFREVIMPSKQRGIVLYNITNV